MNNYRYIICKKDSKIWSLLIDADGKTVEIRQNPVPPSMQDTRKEQGVPENSPAAGDIVTARVEKVASNLQAAFIVTLNRQRLYLAFEDLSGAFYTRKGTGGQIQAGDELIVQITREAIKGKLPSASCTLSLRGEYVILSCRRSDDESISPDDTVRTGISRKMNISRRAFWKDAAGRMLRDLLLNEEQEPSPAARGRDTVIWNILVRTNAEEADPRRVRSEMAHAFRVLKQVLAKAPFITCPSLLYRPGERYLERILDLPASRIERIISDDPQIDAACRKFLDDHAPDLSDKLTLYHDPLLSLDCLYSLQSRIREAVSRTVFLSSGAFLVIEQTEAMVVIDVNTGKMDIRKRETKEDLLLKANLEAADEIMRQLRLRSLSGMIVIDFINMKTDQYNQKLMDRLRTLALQDPVAVSVIDMTGLGLVEMTRQKTERAFLYDDE